MECTRSRALYLVAAVFALLTVWELFNTVMPLRSCFDDDDVVRSQLRIPNRVRTQYDHCAADRLNRLIARNASGADRELIDFVRSLVDPPSTHEAKIPSALVIHSPQSAEVDNLLQKKTNGFFLEAGAFDGADGSNTVFLERHRSWTGLLVEMDPFFYSQMLGRSRSAWTINACLSLQPHVTQMSFQESHSQLGRVMEHGIDSRTGLVPCFPVYSLLLALNRTKVDYFSLDIEGFELEVLKTIPFGVLDVSVVSVEYVHSKHSKQDFVDYMTKQGYRVHKDLIVGRQMPFVSVNDFVFVKANM